MMTTTLRIALILVSVATMVLMMRKIRQSKVQIESTIFWIVLAIAALIALMGSVQDLPVPGWTAIGLCVADYVFFLIFHRCPHCGHLLHYLSSTTDCCPYCGESLNDR